jgi:long-chain acyl-CoA synthetase
VDLHRGWGREIVEPAPSPGVRTSRLYAGRRTHASQLLTDAQRWRKLEHLVQGRERLTFGDVERRVNEAAVELVRRGVVPGDRVMVIGANGIDWVLSFWACLRVDAIAVLANPGWARSEFAAAIELTSPSVLLVDEQRYPLDRPAVPTAELRAANPPDSEPLDPPPTRAGELDPAVIIFSSGTTGRARAVALSHRSLIANVHGLLDITHRLPQDVADDREPPKLLQTLPLFHMGGVQALVTAVMTGSAIIFLSGRFDAAEALRLIEEERVNNWACVPTMALRVLQSPDFAGRDLSSLRSVTMGGTMVPKSVAAQVKAAFPAVSERVSSVYGLTEAGGTVAAGSGRQVSMRPGTVGKPIPAVEVKIAGDTGEGEILVRSPGVMVGYWAESHDNPVDADGWLHTGDIGRLDEDGWLYLSGRSKDVIIRGGENIASSSVEEALREHPEVDDVAVVGLPDDEFGEIVAAVVVSPTLTAADLPAMREFAAARLARFQVPARWRFTGEPLPTNDIGKVLKRELRAQFLAE